MLAFTSAMPEVQKGMKMIYTIQKPVVREKVINVYQGNDRLNDWSGEVIFVDLAAQMM